MGQAVVHLGHIATQMHNVVTDQRHVAVQNATIQPLQFAASKTVQFGPVKSENLVAAPTIAMTQIQKYVVLGVPVLREIHVAQKNAVDQLHTVVLMGIVRGNPHQHQPPYPHRHRHHRRKVKEQRPLQSAQQVHLLELSLHRRKLKKRRLLQQAQRTCRPQYCRHPQHRLRAPSNGEIAPHSVSLETTDILRKDSGQNVRLNWIIAAKKFLCGL